MEIDRTKLCDPGYLTEVVPQQEGVSLELYISFLFTLYELVILDGDMHHQQELIEKRDILYQSILDGVLPEDAIQVMNHIQTSNS